MMSKNSELKVCNERGPPRDSYNEIKSLEKNVLYPDSRFIVASNLPCQSDLRRICLALTRSLPESAPRSLNRANQESAANLSTCEEAVDACLYEVIRLNQQEARVEDLQYPDGCESGPSWFILHCILKG